MSRVPHPALRRGVHVATCTLVGALSFLAVSAAGTTPDGVSAAQELSVPSPAAPAGEERLERLVERHDCSATGFGADVIPGSSLVLQDEVIRHVSFDDGWAVYTGEQAGTLLAVCRTTV